LAAVTKTKFNDDYMTTRKPTQQVTKTTNICKTKPNEIKAWFKSPRMPAGHEMD